jgi:hypothetical protein
MEENCLVEHASSLFPRLDQRSERASCSSTSLTEKLVILLLFYFTGNLDLDQHFFRW